MHPSATSELVGRAAPARSSLAPLLLGFLLMPFGSTSLSVVVPRAAVDLRVAAPALAGWLVTTYLVAGITVQGLGGAFGERFGHRRVIIAGQLIFLASSVVAFVAPSAAWLVLARAGVAVAGAAVGPCALAELRSSVPSDRLGRALAAMGIAAAVSAALGPLVSGEVLRLLGWRATFLTLVPVSVTALLLLRAGAPSVGHNATSFSPLDALLVGATLVTGSLAFQLGSVPLALFSAALLAVAVVHARSVPAPVLDPGLLANRVLRASGGIIALHNLVFYALVYAVPLWLSRNDARSNAGRVLLALLAANVVASALGSRMAERFGPRPVIFAGVVAALAGVVQLGPAVTHTNTPWLCAALSLVGAGLGVAFAPAQVAALSSSDEARGGRTASLVSVARYVGGLAGVALLGRLSAPSSLALAFAVVLGLSLALLPWMPARATPGR